MLTLGGLEEDHLEGRYPDSVVSHWQGLVQEAEEQLYGFLVVEELPSVLGWLKSFHISTC